ncbi:G-protein coupled receptor 161-like [Actinia tenebrosa]|uniref:G-protein coupled receptor 161-like n=1 Tax=Actinia tenebrosa TaxID=6105 RepID=A0A6P8I1A0_ACTTE|nr:G-protein coupled receptor 161-like [Actinia tenebrosa]XP_031561528.1 G-protein coupled receptor 161-like [Actinia tenebrosa]
MDNEQTLKAIQEDYLKLIEHENQRARGQAEKNIESLLMGILFLVSFLANATICTVLLQSNHRQTASNVLLLSLILANLLISVSLIPFNIASVIADEWLFGTTWCETSGFLVNTLFSGSNLSIVAIAIHRYYFVVKPLALKIDVRRAHFIVGFLWFSSLTCAVPPLFGWNSYAYSPGKAHCTLMWKSGGPALFYSIYYSLWCFLIPLLIILFVYKSIYNKAKKQRKLGTMATGKFPTNGHIPRAASLQSIDNQQLACGCFPKCTSQTQNNNFYMQRNQIVSSVSSTSFSFESSTQSLPGRLNVQQRKEALRRQVSRHSSVIQQRTFQSVSAIVVSFIVCLSPYFFINWWSLFSQSSPHRILDFLTSWLYLIMTAVNPVTYGYSNRQIRRAVKRLPLAKRFFKAHGRGRAYQMDATIYKKPAISQRNEALEHDS